MDDLTRQVHDLLMLAAEYLPKHSTERSETTTAAGLWRDGAWTLAEAHVIDALVATDAGRYGSTRDDYRHAVALLGLVIAHMQTLRRERISAG